jgi:hypothetical protein
VQVERGHRHREVLLMIPQALAHPKHGGAFLQNCTPLRVLAARTRPRFDQIDERPISGRVEASA